MSRNKQQGTEWENEVVRLAQAAGLRAWRLAEQGQNDQGDVAVETPAGEIVIIEARNRGNLPVHAAVEKANAKARHPSAFPATFAVVAWKRLVQTDGERRRQAGKPVAILELGDLLGLLAGRTPGRVRLRG